MEAESLECAVAEGLFAVRVANLYAVFHFNGERGKILTPMYLKPSTLGGCLHPIARRLLFEQYEVDHIETVLPENFPKKSDSGMLYNQLTEAEASELLAIIHQE